jgi:16S rRNA (cytosine967-C5)-methyltransferase
LTARHPRRAAFDILIRVEKERSYADILLDRELSTGTMGNADRRLLTELVYGVLRRMGYLDHVIGHFASKPLDRLDPPVRVLLRLGLYQFMVLDRIPVSAAVNETVKIAREVVPRAAGFINAILRRASETGDKIGYPDRERQPAHHLSVRHSHPLWLTEMWLEQLGLEEAEALATVMSEIPPVTIRANALRISRDALLASLRESGFTAAPTPYSPAGITLATGQPPRLLPGHGEGLFSIQDESSQLAALLLAPQPGETVLDLCAAPGGKATFLAELMGDTGRVLACDIRQQRVRLIDESASRLGITSVVTRTVDALKPLDQLRQELPGGMADRILLDAPCSGLGTLRRNPEGQWWKNRDTIRLMAVNQLTMLKQAAELLKPGGVLLYSTCTTTLSENEEVVERFLASNPRFSAEPLGPLFPAWQELFTAQGNFRSWPHRHGMDGFFAARLRRTDQHHQETP